MQNRKRSPSQRPRLQRRHEREEAQRLWRLPEALAWAQGSQGSEEAPSVACGEVSADPEGQQEAVPGWCEAQPAAWEPWEELWGSQASVLQADRPFPAEEAWP